MEEEIVLEEVVQSILEALGENGELAELLSGIQLTLNNIATSLTHIETWVTWIFWAVLTVACCKAIHNLFNRLRGVQ